MGIAALLRLGVQRDVSFSTPGSYHLSIRDLPGAAGSACFCKTRFYYTNNIRILSNIISTRFYADPFFLLASIKPAKESRKRAVL